VNKSLNGFAGLKGAVLHAVTLSISSLISYVLIIQLLQRIYFISRNDDLLGAMWAVIATIFVYRTSRTETIKAALSRIAATSISFVLCLFYLLIFPSGPGGMAVLIGFAAIVMTLAGRTEDIITTGITTTVVMVVAAISTQHAWQQPILRLIDTIVGVGVGIAAAWVESQLMSYKSSHM
jgi:uncharacterized membrane protein YgaE (UPF0421/DUF939 family)